MLDRMDAKIFSAGSLIPMLTGLGFVLVCLSLRTRQGMQVAAGDSAFCGKGRYLRTTAQCELLGMAPAGEQGGRRVRQRRGAAAQRSDQGSPALAL